MTSSSPSLARGVKYLAATRAAAQAEADLARLSGVLHREPAKPLPSVTRRPVNER